MNVKESLDILMGRLARTSPELRTQCLLEMKLAQESLEAGETLPWFILTESAFTETVIGERRVKLPPDFLRESEEQRLVWFDDQECEHEIIKGGYDELMKEYGSAAEGDPEKYCIRGPYIQLFPTPTSVRKVEYSSYYGRQQVPLDSVDSQNAWFANAPDLLIARTGIVIASNYLKDAELMTLFDGLLRDAHKRLFHNEVAREEANRERLMEDD